LRRISIPRWLLIAMAALLAFALFAVLVHPDYDVTKATIGDALTALVLALSMIGAARAASFALRWSKTTVPVAQPQPLPIMERTCIRRI
jgi:hypothetical protein